MKHTFTISGMTCEGCKAKVIYLLHQVNGVKNVQINLEKAEAEIEMEQHLETSMLKDALRAYPKYQLTEKPKINLPIVEEPEKSWLETYKPVLLIFIFITGVTFLTQLSKSDFNSQEWMNHFMAGFFIVFSFFKFLNLKGFAESYAMYDVVAKQWSGYGYAYPFIELGLGVSYLLAIAPLMINGITIIIMGISLIGVFQSVLNKSKIKCACLGDVFNLPMSTITIIEDALMIVMSIISIIMLF